MSNRLEDAMREAAARALARDPGLRLLMPDAERAAIEARRDEIIAAAGEPERKAEPEAQAR